MKIFKSLRGKLFLWYVGSLLFLISYFLLFIHYRSVMYGLQILAALFVLLAVIQFFFIYKITHSITKLTSKMKTISDQNLQERVEGIKGEDEIGQLAKSFNNLLDRLSEAFAREKRFIGDVAHELKTPLATMKSSFEVALSKKRTNEEYESILKSAVAEADQLSSLLNNVLDLAWTEARSNREATRVNLTELTKELSEIGQKLAVGKAIEVVTSIEPEIYTTGFKDKLARAILNIMENAVKYSPSGSRIEVILEKAPGKALINITDQGIGIKAEELPHIFDRFYRGSKTDKVLGSGLGLAIAKSIVNLHQGEIKVKSTPGKGSSFIIVLPLS